LIPVKFVVSAASAADFPHTGLPEIALVGRSNVGKSSLINALVQKTVARTSAAPGKTRLANYYLLDDSFYLVDLPGYGYARGGEESGEAFAALVGEYFKTHSDPRRRIAGILHLIDARHPALPQDAAAHQWLARTGFPVTIAATKVDKLTRAERTASLKQLERSYDAPLVAVSSARGAGLDQLRRRIQSLLGDDGSHGA
jgi:GTP-binding protein